MNNDQLRQHSLQTLERLDKAARERDLRGIDDKCMTALTTGDVQARLTAAWELVFEAREAVQRWAKSSQVDVGFKMINAQLNHVLGGLDACIFEFEEPSAASRRHSR